MVFNDLENAGALKSFKRLGFVGFAAALCDLEGVADAVLYLFWKGAQVLQRGADPVKGLQTMHIDHVPEPIYSDFTIFARSLYDPSNR